MFISGIIWIIIERLNMSFNKGKFNWIEQSFNELFILLHKKMEKLTLLYITPQNLVKVWSQKTKEHGLTTMYDMQGTIPYVAVMCDRDLRLSEVHKLPHMFMQIDNCALIACNFRLKEPSLVHYYFWKACASQHAVYA